MLERSLIAGFPTAPRDLLARYLNGELSAAMRLMYWLQATPGRDEIRAVLQSAIVASEAAGMPR